MKIFLDTANIDQIREVASLGILDGVTTNPTLIAKEKRDYREALAEICEVVNGPVSAEALGTDAETMVREGRSLSEIARNIAVKLPLTTSGIKATRRLSEEGLQVNMTLCFTPIQALLAAKAGAAFVSPFIGRLDDRGQNGMDLVEEIRRVYDNFGFNTEILTASIRHPVHVLQAALVGSDIVTIPYAVFQKLIHHPLTDEGLARFLEDYRKAFGSDTTLPGT